MRMAPENATMTGKVCLVTGGTAGIGLVTARELAARGATVVIISRNAEKCAVVAQQIQQQTGNSQVTTIAADLSLMREVRRAAEEFRRRHTRLDVLVNNAGAVFAGRQVTAEGYERTFALNHLSYFYLTTLLLDRLQSSAPARIVNVASQAQQAGALVFDDLMGERRYRSFGAYSQSKLANIVFTYELARRLEGTGVTANVLHPGFVASGFGHNNGGLFSVVMKLVSPFARSPEKGAETSVYLATSPDVEGISGRYYADKREIRSQAASYDPAIARRLWEVSEELVRRVEVVPA